VSQYKTLSYTKLWLLRRHYSNCGYWDGINLNWDGIKLNCGYWDGIKLNCGYWDGIKLNCGYWDGINLNCGYWDGINLIVVIEMAFIFVHIFVSY